MARSRPRRDLRTASRRSTRLEALPRLPDKQKRLPGHSALPPAVRDGINAIALHEGWSRSRVIAWLICDWFQINPETAEPLRLTPLDGAAPLLKRNGRWL